MDRWQEGRTNTVASQLPLLDGCWKGNFWWVTNTQCLINTHREEKENHKYLNCLKGVQLLSPSRDEGIAVPGEQGVSQESSLQGWEGCHLSRALALLLALDLHFLLLLQWETGITDVSVKYISVGMFLLTPSVRQHHCKHTFSLTCLDGKCSCHSNIPKAHASCCLVMCVNLPFYQFKFTF